MATSGTRLVSDLPIPPGEVLEEELDAVQMTQKELAARLARPPQAVNEIIRGKKAITPETALELEKVLGIPASYWVNLEAIYRMTIARNRDRDELSQHTDWLDQFPVRQMEKLHWIPKESDKRDKLRRLLEFFGVASIPAYQDAVRFRITPAAAAKVSHGALWAWLRRGELEAKDVETAPYDGRHFAEALSEARGMTTQSPEEFSRRLRQICAESGVVVLAVQELPKSGAHGAARWLTDDKALIQMSLRYKWQDIFWFSFFHEAGHLLKHRSHKIIVDGVDGEEALEREADEFAANFLIHPDRWDEFTTYRTDFTAAAVLDFADSLGIDPGIVVGRLQKERHLRYNQLTSLKGRYVWTSPNSDAERQ